MTASPPRFAAVLIALVLGGCTSTVQPDAPVALSPVTRQSADPEIPVSVLGVGDSFGADLRGDGHATITVTEVSAVPAAAPGRVRLVVTVAILLDKAGDPITGGPENFRFRDAPGTVHKAQTGALRPALPSVSLTTTGQRSGGKLFFDIPAGSAKGGYLQLMTGNLVHALWKV
ncbi:hypothetical protein F4553_002131 [Allocatelliglobosispora scoriae]|uniref:DUF4352 domain-containing protein n=1 Tax=Allocatelliglobosispora scoriae TaxID=643052 RepID=A0A841BPS6_9ACTN|nr:hypothetical protein [Allocatelliglobosispora scoriae]MBB5868752.1 hypothetical protein [Allocatelliglobosispora scoriae]